MSSTGYIPLKSGRDSGSQTATPGTMNRMTRAEAEERARTLQAEDPQRDTHRFVARPGPDGGGACPGSRAGVG
jgi:hypothetical protein